MKLKIFLLVTVFSLLIANTYSQPGRFKKRGKDNFSNTFEKDSNTIRIVSTPNPSVFPLLLAIAEEASVPVELIPVGTQKEAEEKLVNGEADGIIGMTYMAARMKAKSLPDLEIKSIVYWSGFFEVTAPGVTSLTDLKNKRLIISGPAGTGQNGGPDIFFQAAIKQAGLSLTDFTIQYLPVQKGVEKVVSGDADAILLAEPAASGMIMMAGMKKDKDFVKGINFQMAFGKYETWQAGELPLGGLSIKTSVLNNEYRQKNVERLITLYESKASKLMNGGMMTGRKVSQQLDKYFGSILAQKLPGMIINKAIKEGTLKYHPAKWSGKFRDEVSEFISKILQ